MAIIRDTRLKLLSEIISDSNISQNIYVSDYFNMFRDDMLLTVIEAMKIKRKIRLFKFKADNKDSLFDVLTVAPYQLHNIEYNKWYMIGQTDECGLMRIPLDFIWKKVQIINNSYDYPSDYTQEVYEKKLYGSSDRILRIIVEIKYSSDIKLFGRYPHVPFKHNVNSVQEHTIMVNYDMPLTPFAIYVLLRKLKNYGYKVLNKKNPVSYFSTGHYWDDILLPVKI